MSRVEIFGDSMPLTVIEHMCYSGITLNYDTEEKIGDVAGAERNR
ncbi:MAG: hypothetical protein PHY18_05210 [Dehalococcoidales bacterium]|nr:hypothetical protein [Dehalococcoidales bacterium]